MGIPFAEPPIENLRFKPPQPIKPWDDVLHAHKIKPACVQNNYNILKGQPIGQYGVEDCLYLDIYTPSIDHNKRPAVVFLYNDRFVNSYNKSKDYAPDFFIEEDIVVITISHRLSMFGFLSFEDDTLSGNAGLKDIVAGLEWVSQNIHSFGGDSEKITLLGSQGGAAAVDLLIRSKANVLFRSAILQSGTSLSSEFLQENVRKRAKELGNLLEIPTSSNKYLLEELNKINTLNILPMELKASPADYYKDNQRSVLTFGPVVEKDSNGLITDYPENFSEKINMPILIGSNSREGLHSSLMYLMQPHFFNNVEKDFHFLIPLRVNYKFDPNHDSYYEAVQDIKDFYFTEGEVSLASISQYITYMSDLKVYPINVAAQIFSNITSGPVFYYHFDYYSSLSENKNNILKLSSTTNGIYGAPTGDELCYLFRCPSLNDKYIKQKGLKSKTIEVQRKMIKLWANFIKYGNPTPADDNPLGDVEWPSYNMDTKKYLHINENITVKESLLRNRFRFWDKFIDKWGKKLEYLRFRKDEL
ncbi:unnamed protein product [Danaus chrysippus]|uniref:(African queen) hypothetical protein n=1 Tax=Danaus chrysippus TaxID=151541 RepID=A0A8J2W1S7_9NEOP|nr:unnamed protein product [Danaus chrysippus]